MKWTKIDKDDEGTWGLDEMVEVWEFGTWPASVHGSALSLKRFHGAYWRPLSPNPHEQPNPPADDGCVEVRVAVTVDEDGMGWQSAVLYEPNGSPDTLATLARLIGRTGPDAACHAFVITARVPRYTPPPVVEIEGEVE